MTRRCSRGLVSPISQTAELDERSKEQLPWSGRHLLCSILVFLITSGINIRKFFITIWLENTSLF